MDTPSPKENKKYKDFGEEILRGIFKLTDEEIAALGDSEDSPKTEENEQD